MTIRPSGPFIAAALLTLALSATASEQEIRNNIALGALVFSENCRKCHELDGYGEEALYPSLHNQALLRDKSLLIQTILKGRTRHQENGEGGTIRLMPSLDFLSDAEIVAIIVFITNSWGDQPLEVTEQDVREARASMAGSSPAAD